MFIYINTNAWYYCYMEPLEDPKLEKFAQSVAYGFTPPKAADEAHLRISPTEAGMLTDRPDVRARITGLCEKQNFSTSYEHFRVARQLEQDRDFAYELGNPAAAINATVQRAKLLGVFVEKSEVVSHVAVASNKELTAEEWSAKFGPKTEARDSDAENSAE